MTHPLRPLAAVTVLLLATPLALAQGQMRNDKPRSTAQDEDEYEYEEFVPEPVTSDHAFEFVLSGDGLHLGYRNGLERGTGYAGLNLFLGEDNDWLASGRLMRFGEPVADQPLGLGLGLGLYAGSSDEPDASVGALTLIGAIDYTFPLSYDVRLGVETAYAPEASSFADATRVLDVLVRAEIDVSEWATGFVGYRFTEIDLDDAEDRELEKAAQIGVRLGL